MANFNTHLTVAAVGSGIVAVGMHALGFLETKEMLYCWLMGITGGLLPDLDSDDPRALGMIFNIITGLIWIGLFIGYVEKSSLVEFALVFLLTTLIVRGGIYMLFLKFTTHRGNYHSIAGALVTSFIVAALAGRAIDAYSAWVLAGFCFMGFMTHLTLDELYKVNLVDQEIDRPLFSAFKMVSLEAKPLAGAMVAAALILWLFTPGIKPLVDGYNSRAEIAKSKVVNIWPSDNTLFGVQIPDITEYIDYDIQIRPTEKTQELTRDLRVSEEQVESTQLKIKTFWEDMKAAINGLKAEPKGGDST